MKTIQRLAQAAGQVAVIAVTAGLGAPLMASAAGAPAGYYEQMASSAGGLDAMALACGEVDQAKVDAHRDSLRTSFTKDGMDKASFDKAYGTSFDDVTKQAKANPAKAKQSCEQLKAMGKQMEQAIKAQTAKQAKP